MNGDSGTAYLKGTGRPIVPAAERARLLAALQPVSAVVIFEEATAEALVRALKPDIDAKGGDYREARRQSAPLSKRWAVRLC